jgi:hypothetical protein
MNNNEEDYIDDAFDDEGYEDETDDKKKAANVGNGHIQNALVDKEVEQVIMKSASNVLKDKKSAGYALPGDDDEGDEDQEDLGDDDDEDVQEDHDEDGDDGMDGEDDEDID